MAKQNPQTSAKLLRQLSRPQLELWKKIGRQGVTLADLELQRPGKDILEEVRILEDKNVLVLEELRQVEDPPSKRNVVLVPAASETQPSYDFAGYEDEEEQPVSALEERVIETRPVRARRISSRQSAAVERPTRIKKASHDRSERHGTQKRDSLTSGLSGDPLRERKAARKRAQRSTEPQNVTALRNSDATQDEPSQAAAEQRVKDAIAKPLQLNAHRNALQHEPQTQEQDLLGAEDTDEPTVPEAQYSKAQPTAELVQAGEQKDDEEPIALQQTSADNKDEEPIASETSADEKDEEPITLQQTSADEKNKDDLSIASPETADDKNEDEQPIPLQETSADDSTLPQPSALEAKLLALKVDLTQKEKARILQVARAVESGDICGLLGLPSTAKRKEIKRSYHSLSKELHPDRYFGRDLKDFGPLLSQVFTSLSQYVKALNDKRTTLPGSYSSTQARRMSQRFHLSLAGQAKCDSWQMPEPVRIQDISDGGLFLLTELAATVGETIRINLESTEGLIGIIGKVVSIRDSDKARRERRNGGLGIRFENANELDYDRLQTLLKQAREQTPAYTSAIPVQSEASRRLALGSRIIHRKEHIIGIDFGTTNTAVSAVIDGRVQIVPWPNGSYSMPSVVSFPERNKCVVGHEAQKHLLGDPRNVINSGKRLLGRQLDDPAIASYMAEARFAHHKGPDGTVIAELCGEEYAIPQICSYLLAAAKHSATQILGAEPNKVVLTIPVSFDDKQIDSMRRVAKLAQLDVIEFIEEPCAAAIANQEQEDFKGIVGVYDFGGGTFDFSLVEAGSGDMRILATTGDSWLGGDDFDIAIANASAEVFCKSQGTDLRQRVVEWQQLVFACEQAKRELSRRERTQVVVPEVMRNADGPIDLRINLVRSKVEQLWADSIRRSIDTCNQALSLAGVPKSKLNAIYLSGGTSYIPAIRRTLIERFNVPVHLGLAPEHAVCAGAGVRAAVLQGTQGVVPKTPKQNKRR